ncbi:hypothetical protein niasHT_020063 [Heterodera trifolii]|uniref:Uncharacterized protein n=1 Tax=Heterodera trifolii TaxID=157864 RepID=A0ABD2LL59_9BILA
MHSKFGLCFLLLFVIAWAIASPKKGSQAENTWRRGTTAKKTSPKSASEMSDRRRAANAPAEKSRKPKANDGTASKQRLAGKSANRQSIDEHFLEAAANSLMSLSEERDEAEQSRHQSQTSSKRQRLVKAVNKLQKQQKKPETPRRKLILYSSDEEDEQMPQRTLSATGSSPSNLSSAANASVPLFSRRMDNSSTAQNEHAQCIDVLQKQLGDLMQGDTASGEEGLRHGRQVMAQQQLMARKMAQLSSPRGPATSAGDASSAAHSRKMGRHQQKPSPSSGQSTDTERKQLLSAIISPLRPRPPPLASPADSSQMRVAQRNANATTVAGRHRPTSAVAGSRFTSPTNGTSTPSRPLLNSEWLMEIKNEMLNKLAEVEDAFPRKNDALRHGKQTPEQLKEIMIKMIKESIAAVGFEPTDYLDSKVISEQMTTNGDNTLLEKRATAFTEALALKILRGKVKTSAEMINHMRVKLGGDKFIKKILDETAVESAEFESQIGYENIAEMPETGTGTLLFTYIRLNIKLINAIKLACGRDNAGKFTALYNLSRWPSKVSQMFVEIMMTNAQKQPQGFASPQQIKWLARVFELESTIESAKLVIRIALPPILIEKWVDDENWAVLKEKLKSMDMENFMAYHDVRPWFGCKFAATVCDNWGYRFGNKTVQSLTESFTEQTAEQSEPDNLVELLTLFNQMLTTLSDEKFDVVKTQKIKRERKITRKMLEICRIIFDAKFDWIKKLVIDKFWTLDQRIKRQRSFGGGAKTTEGSAEIDQFSKNGN